MTITSERPVATVPKWAGGFETLHIENEYPISEIDGEVPKSLNGTLFRVCPAANDVGGVRYKHWFDGDGMASAIVFRDGKASFRNRYVKTEGRLREQKAGKPLYAGFGTLLPGGPLKNVGKTVNPKNAANTNIVYHGCNLLALWEGGLPHRLDPATLDTLGEYDYDGAIKGLAFSAHPKILPEGEMLNFGVSFGPRNSVHVYSVDGEGALTPRKPIGLPFGPFLHDFLVTERYSVFLLSPYAANPLPLISGLRTIADSFEWKPDRGLEVIVLPRDGGPESRFRTDSSFVVHTANAYEDGDELVLDVVAYGDASVMRLVKDVLSQETEVLNARPNAYAPGYLERYRLNPSTGAIGRTQLSDVPCEFPRLDPRRVGRRHRYVYGAATGLKDDSEEKMFRRIARIDTETGQTETCFFGEGVYPGEPVFVPETPDAPEDRGWVLTLCYDGNAHSSFLAILDATNIAAGPIARLRLRHHVPFGFHGNFVANLDLGFIGEA